MNNIPYISVIVPVYNGETTIGKCVEALLNQDYPKDKYEVIIVDNNSKDKTAEVIDQYPVTYALEKGTQSSYAARNSAIKMAKGDVLAFTDSDCIANNSFMIILFLVCCLCSLRNKVF